MDNALEFLQAISTTVSVLLPVASTVLKDVDPTSQGGQQLVGSAAAPGKHEIRIRACDSTAQPDTALSDPEGNPADANAAKALEDLSALFSNHMTNAQASLAASRSRAKTGMYQR
jgi:hypothetical protein